MRLYVGYDDREAIGHHVFCASVLRHATIPVSITALDKQAITKTVGGSIREGSNAFTFSRFLIPYLEGYRGSAVFMDGSDMLCRADLAELEQLPRNSYAAVQVVKHSYKTKFPRKYVGTSMECENRDYARKQWASVMMINCAHDAWRYCTPDVVQKAHKLDLLQLSFIPDRFIHTLPIEWNWLADEHGRNDAAKILHWTAGVPAIESCCNAPQAEEWHAQLATMIRPPFALSEAA